MPRRQAMARCEHVGRNRSPVGLQCHIDNRGYCKESFAWEYSHQGKRQTIKIVSLKRVRKNSYLGQPGGVPQRRDRASYARSVAKGDRVLDPTPRLSDLGVTKDLRARRIGVELFL